MLLLKPVFLVLSEVSSYDVLDLEYAAKDDGSIDEQRGTMLLKAASKGHKPRLPVLDISCYEPTIFGMFCRGSPQSS